MRRQSKSIRHWLAAVVTLSVAVAGATAPPAGAGVRPAADHLLNARLLGVSCPTTTFCVMVGDDGGAANSARALIETWNNHQWTTRIRSASSSLTSVSCVAGPHCVAVGYLHSGSIDEPVADTLDGSTWSSAVLPHATGSDTYLQGVSCASATRCVATGAQNTGGSYRAVSEVLTGSTWTRTALTAGGSLNAVSCAGTDHCVAAGSVSAAPLIDGWNGTSWTRTSVSVTGASQLSGVACASTTACTAVGYRNTATPLALVLAGGSWTQPTVPLPSGATAGYLFGVSCRSAGSCLAVGRYDQGGSFALSETWDGQAWTRHTVPDPAGTAGSTFEGVSCAAATSCVAVGETNLAGTGEITLAEQWNGSSWSPLSPH